MFRCLPTTPLMRWRFQHTCRWIWRVRGCLRRSPKGKKPNNWLQKHGDISAYLKACLIIWRWIKKNRRIWSSLFFTIWFSWILNFIIKCNNPFSSTLGILATSDSNLVDNHGLRKYSTALLRLPPPVQLATVGWADELSRFGVWRCTAVVGGYHSWTTKDVTDLKHWNENFEAWKLWQAYTLRIQVKTFDILVRWTFQLQFIHDKNFYWKSITIQLKKTDILGKIINYSKFFGNLKLHLKKHD